MVIHINSNRINTPSGKPGKAGERKAQTQGRDDGAFVAPRRPELNFIPAAESLATLILSAVAAMRKGVFWDRGTIVNLIV